MLFQAVRTLAAEDQDRATQQNRRGYSQADTSFGHELAGTPDEEWTPALQYAAWVMISKYSDQLAAHGINIQEIPRPDVVEEDTWREARAGIQRRWRDRRASERAAAEGRPGRRCEVEGEEFALYFAYRSADVMARVRALPRRRFAQPPPRWVVRATPENLVPLRAILREFGFFVTPEATAHLERLQAEAPVANGLPEGVPPARTILERDGAYELRFPFDTEIMHALRAIPGARFVRGEDPHWRVPPNLFALRSLPPLVENFGFATPPLWEDDIREKSSDFEILHSVGRIANADFPVPGLSRDLKPYEAAVAAYATLARKCVFNLQHSEGFAQSAIASVQASQAYPALVITSPGLEELWKQEFEALVPELEGKVMVSRSAAPVTPWSDVIICSRMSLASRPELVAMDLGSLVIDDGTYLENDKSAQSRATAEIAQDVPVRLVNLPLDLDPQALIASLEVSGLMNMFGGRRAFVSRFCRVRRNRFGSEIIGFQNEAEMEELLRSTGFLRRGKQEWIALDAAHTQGERQTPGLASVRRM